MIRTLRPDVVMFQEMGFSHKVDSMLSPLKYSPLPKSLSRKELSPAIYSRHPIVKAERIDSMKNFVWADVVIRKDTIRLYNLHLHTTAIRRDEGRYIENHEYLEEEGDMEKLRSMVNRLSENNKLRSTQADTISHIIAESPYPVIVCGDFNDTPVSYTYRRVSRKLQDAFREAGRGYSHTYRGFFDMLRIDYILFSDEFEPLSYEVVDSWGLEQTIKGRGENADTLLVRAYGNGMPLPDEQQLRDAMILPPTAEKIKMDNRIIYSDHYPVFVRLLYNGKNH
jgi:endonuclease/exonuclease/phosphatase family metal-dependent hydrolase